MIDEEQLQNALPRRLCGRCLRFDDHSLGNGRGAGDLELGRLLDLDEAHAAYARDGQAGMIAVMRHEDARLLRGLDDKRPRRHTDRRAVDGEIDHAVSHQLSVLS